MTYHVSSCVLSKAASTNDPLAEHMNTWAAEGWRLVTVTTHEMASDIAHYFYWETSD